MAGKICFAGARKQLYFRAFVAHFVGRMTQRFFRFWILALAGLPLAQLPLRADGLVAAPLKSALVESNVAYLRVREVDTNLAEEISAAQSSLSASNKIAGTILDLRFADGDDAVAAAAAARLFAGKKPPLAILVNDETRGAAATLAAALRGERAGLIFGGAAAELKPDIAVSPDTNAEKVFWENPYAVTATNAAAPAETNDFLPFVDHMSEAELVRERRKDGADDDSAPTAREVPARPVIRDPVLARAVDLIEGLAVVRGQRL